MDRQTFKNRTYVESKVDLKSRFASLKKQSVCDINVGKNRLNSKA